MNAESALDLFEAFVTTAQNEQKNIGTREALDWIQTMRDALESDREIDETIRWQDDRARYDG